MLIKDYFLKTIIYKVSETLLVFSVDLYGSDTIYAWIMGGQPTAKPVAVHIATQINIWQLWNRI